MLTHERFSASGKAALSVTITTPTVVSASGHTTGGSSSAFSAPLQIAKPYIGSFSPGAMTVGAPITMTTSSPDASIQIEGANFLPGVTASVTTSSGQTQQCKLETSNHGTHATLSLPLTLLQLPDQLTVHLTNSFCGLNTSIDVPYQVMKESFAGAIDGTLYAVDGDGNLRWYRDIAQDGTTCWAAGSGNVIAEGWGDYLLVIPTEAGVIYAVTTEGELLWFKDLAHNGTSSWAEGSGNVIAKGWATFQRVVYGGHNMLYAIDKSGAVLWYQDQACNGTSKWATNSGATIATGWNQYLKVVSGAGATFYAVDQAGNLHWYQDVAHNGTKKWATNSGAVVSAGGWTRFTHILSGGKGILYPAQANGGLLWYQDRACNGTQSWAQTSGALIATGWVYEGDNTEDDEG
jgi:hypothetical protein